MVFLFSPSLVHSPQNHTWGIGEEQSRQTVPAAGAVLPHLFISPELQPSSYAACSLAPTAAESSLLAGLPHCPWSALSFIEILDTLRVESVSLTTSAPLNPHPLRKCLTSPTRSTFTHKTRTLISYFSYSGLYCARRIFIYIAQEGRVDLIPISQMRNITSKRSCSLVWSHQFI